MFQVLVVEDDNKLRQLFCTVLSKNGYRAIPAGDGEEALALLDKEYVDLVVSDIMMPGMDGFELAESLRAMDKNLPILMVTVREQFEDKQKGYLVGIDDYMVKPIDVNEMVLRVNALLRRAKIVSDRRLAFGSTALEYDSLAVNTAGHSTVLPQKEFYLLYKLLSYPGKTFTRQHLMDEIWGPDSDTDERTVDVHINRLRDRFKDQAEFSIETIRGLGYRAVRNENEPV